MCPGSIEFPANDERRGGDFWKAWTQVQVEGTGQDRAHERFIRLHDRIDESLKLPRIRWSSCDQRIDEPFRELAVSVASNPMVDSSSKIRFYTDGPGASPNQNELFDSIGLCSSQSLRSNATHRIADDVAPIDTQ